MAKYTEQLGKKIADAIEQDEYTLGEICAMHDISRKTFYQWARKYSDFKEMIDDARADRDEKLAQKARKILKQRLEHGYTVYIIIEKGSSFYLKSIPFRKDFQRT